MFNSNRIKNFLRYNAWLIFFDILAFILSYLLTLYIRFYVNGEFRPSILYYQDYFWRFIPYYTIISIVIFAVFRLYGSIWQYAGVRDINRIIIANLITALLQVGISICAFYLIPETEHSSTRMPISYYVIGAVVQFFVTLSSRFIFKFIRQERQRINRKSAVNVMLAGTGETGRIVRRQIEEDPNNAVNIVCIFSYRDQDAGVMLDGVPIVSNIELIKNHIDKYQVQRVILADSIMPMHVREQIKTSCQDNKIDVQDFSGFLRYDNNGLSFQKLMECVNGKVIVLKDEQISRYDNGEQALMTIVGKHDIKTISIKENSFFVELISYKVMPLISSFITNRPDVALIAEKYGVDRIWIDLETRGKEERQRNLNSVKSNHSITDIAEIKPLLTKAEMMVRINPWHDGSQQEIDAVIAAGADIVMLPYWKTVDEVRSFIEAIDRRSKTSLLLETKEAVECVDDVIKIGGIDEIHIGLNDLHLSYGMSFMFEPLADGIVETLCKKFKAASIPFGFGGIARLGDGLLPAEKIVMEHYRLGSSRAILSRTFCDVSKIENIEEIDMIFRNNMNELREYEMSMADVTQEEFIKNKEDVSRTVAEIVEKINRVKNNQM